MAFTIKTLLASRCQVFRTVRSIGNRSWILLGSKRAHGFNIDLESLSIFDGFTLPDYWQLSRFLPRVPRDTQSVVLLSFSCKQTQKVGFVQTVPEFDFIEGDFFTLVVDKECFVFVYATNFLILVLMASNFFWSKLARPAFTGRGVYTRESVFGGITLHASTDRIAWPGKLSVVLNMDLFISLSCHLMVDFFGT